MFVTEPQRALRNRERHDEYSKEITDRLATKTCHIGGGRGRTRSAGRRRRGEHAAGPDRRITAAAAAADAVVFSFVVVVAAFFV